jgi:hypothetical protein
VENLVTITTYSDGGIWHQCRVSSAQKLIFYLYHIMLPVELLHVIAGVDMETYRLMLALPPFARSLDPGIIADFMISFGFGIKITCKYIKWTRDGIAHRNDGPAMTFSDGGEYWCQHGKFHRDGGPAVTYSDGRQFWYWRGESIRPKKLIFYLYRIMLPVDLLHVIAGVDMETYRSMLSLPSFARSLNPNVITDFMISFGFGIEITRNCITWTRDGVPHRTGGPAIIYPNRRQSWYRRGIIHRDDGPAMICSDGGQWWCQHGEFHRDDGPARIYSDGEQIWYRHGKRHRDGKPAVIYSGGGQSWYQHGKLHRDGGPAVAHSDGTQHWYQHGKLHRDGGPAVVHADGTQHWYQHGELIQPKN